MFSKKILKIAKFLFGAVNKKYLGVFSDDILKQLLNHHTQYNLTIDSAKEPFKNTNPYQYITNMLVESERNKIFEKQKFELQQLLNWLKQIQDEIKKSDSKFDFNKQFVQKFLRMLLNGNIDANILNNNGKNQVKEVIKNYLKYYEFFEKQQIEQLRKFQFEKLSDFSKVSLKYSTRYQKIKNITEGCDQTYRVGNFIIAKYTCSGNSDNWRSFSRATAGSGWCVTSSSYAWDNYKPPYFLILQGEKIYSLANFNGYSQNYIFGRNGQIPQMPQNLTKKLVQLIKEAYNGEINTRGAGFLSLLNYIDISDLIDLLDKEKITFATIQPRIIKSLQQGRDHDIQKILSNADKFPNIDLTCYISTSKQFNSMVVDKQMDLSKQQVIQIMFNSFANCNDSAKKLFKRILRYNDNGNGVYVQSDTINKDLLQQINLHGNKLTDLITKKSQILLLQQFDRNIITNQVAKKIIYNMCDSNRTVDIPAMEQAVKRLKNNYEEDVQFLTKIITLRKNGVIQYLAQNTNMNFNNKMQNGCYPIFYVLSHKYDTIAKILRQNNKIDFTKISKEDSVDFITQLMQSKDNDYIISFIDSCLNFNIQMSNGDYPILYALKYNMIDVFNKLKQKKQISDSLDNIVNGQSSQNLLYSVMKSKNIDVISYFLKNTNLDFNQVMYGNMIPLFYALKQHMDDVLDLFFENGSKINLQANINGRTLLMWTYETKNYRMFSRLIEKDNNINDEWNFGKFKGLTLFTYSVQNNQNDMAVQILKNKKLDVNKQSPVDYCIVNGRTQLLQKILSHPNFKYDYQNQNGESPIIVAIKYYSKYPMIFDLVLKYTKNLNKQLAKNKNTPLMYAIDYNLPIEKIKQVFDKSSLKVDSDNVNSVITLINKKLNSNPNNDNLKQIKKWLDEKQEKSNIKNKSKTEQDLNRFKFQNKFEEFKSFYDKNKNNIDWLKKTKNKLFIESFILFDRHFKYLEYMLNDLLENDKETLKKLLNLQVRGKKVYQLSTRGVIKNYLEQLYKNVNDENIKTARINNFINNYLKQ